MFVVRGVYGSFTDAVGSGRVLREETGTDLFC